MKRARRQFVLLIVGMLLLPTHVVGGEIAKAPANVRAALFLKLLGFNKRLSGDISVYVLNDTEFAEEFKKGVGRAVGAAKLTAVEEGSALPESPPSVLYCGDLANVDEALGYTRSNKILSISGEPEASSKGITLVVGVLGGKPKVFLNISSSKEENVDWNPAILKISTVVK